MTTVNSDSENGERGEITRRAFLRVGGAAIGGAAIGSAALGGALAGVAGACAKDAGTKGRTTSGGADSAHPGDSSRTASQGASARAIGLQLYTLRQLLAQDLQGTLAKVADIGYREVEFAGYFGREPSQIRRLLDGLHLAAPSAHHPLQDLRTQLDSVLNAAQTIGHRYVVCPWIDEKERTPAGYKKIAGEFNRWGQACRDRGLRFAYHNHDFEFAGAAAGGTVPYDRLLAETDPALVAMELDLYWVTKGGRDPLAYFEQHRGRFPLWHVKDMRDRRGKQEMVPVGEGEIDFAGIFAKAEQAGLEHFFVEHDNPTDPIASVRTSYGTLSRLLA